jgi:RNA polymerase sigma-70 factor (ECF subfamily)
LRIAANTCYDELRRQKRRPTQPLEPVDEDEEEIESPSWLADPAASPEAQVEQQEVSQAIQDCLEGLPPEFRLAVVLVDLQGLDYAEASQVMGKPLGTVKSRLARARLRLQDCLHGFWELLPSIFRPLGES